MIVATRMETLTKDEETGEEKLYLNDLIRCKDCKHYDDDYFCEVQDNYDMTPNDFCSKAEKEEKPKEDAEAFIDNLLEKATSMIEMYDSYNTLIRTNDYKHYAEGRNSAFREIARMIKKYKEKK